MIFDWLIIFLIWFILIILLISIIFYNRLRVRDYYFTNTSTGNALAYGAITDNYYPVTINTPANDLEFIPLYSDRNRNISGGLVILTYSTNSTEGYYRIRAMNGTKQLSEGVYRIDPKLCYNKINFSVDKGDDRKLTFQIQKYDVKKQESISGEPTNINLVKAWAYYY